MSSAAERKDEQRQALIRARQRLDGSERDAADAAIAEAVVDAVRALGVGKLAAFIAHLGEPDLMPAIERLAADGVTVCLPVVEGRRMHFRRWQAAQPMTHNRFGIPEPVHGDRLAAATLDLVLVPSVGFAPDGARLGMGAGFYDRAFGYRVDRPHDPPRLLGVAYSVQEVAALPVDDWDVPLDGVITEQGLRWF